MGQVLQLVHTTVTHAVELLDHSGASLGLVGNVDAVHSPALAGGNASVRISFTHRVKESKRSGKKSLIG